MAGVSRTMSLREWEWSLGGHGRGSHAPVRADSAPLSGGVDGGWMGAAGRVPGVLVSTGVLTVVVGVPARFVELEPGHFGGVVAVEQQPGTGRFVDDDEASAPL